MTNLIPDDSLYHISLRQWIGRLLREKSYNDTMKWVLLQWEPLHMYLSEKGDIDDDDFLFVTLPLIGKFTGKSSQSVGTAIQRLAKVEALYKMPGLRLSDNSVSKYMRLKAFDKVWYAQFTPFAEVAPWGGVRERKVCKHCHAEDSMLHVTHNYDVCHVCGAVENDKKEVKEI